MIQTINKAALYARYISDNQRSESIDAQLRAMQNYCQQNYIVFNIIPDPCCDRHMENNNYGLTLTPRRITILSVIFFQLCGVFGGT